MPCPEACRWGSGCSATPSFGPRVLLACTCSTCLVYVCRIILAAVCLSLASPPPVLNHRDGLLHQSVSLISSRLSCGCDLHRQV